MKRRLLSHAFSEKALRDYEPQVVSLVDQWVNGIAQVASTRDGSVDLGKWLNYLVFDILGQLCFGSSFGLIADTSDRYITTLVPEATRGWYTVCVCPVYDI